MILRHARQVDEVVQFRWVNANTREQLREIAQTATSVGDTERVAKRQKTPVVQVNTRASDTPLADSMPRSAILAVVRLKTAAKTQATNTYALGAKKGALLLERSLDNGMRGGEWARQALRDVVAGSARGSIPSALSALRWWAAFADDVLNADGAHLPPTDHGLACWSRLFRCASTFANYIGYLRLGCHVLGLDTAGTYGPLQNRAKQELKRRQGPPRQKRFIQQVTLSALIEHANHEGNVTMGMLYLAAYVFMLRVPSELLPVVVGKEGAANAALAPGEHSCFSMCAQTLTLRLARRKNRPQGSCLTRSCWCDTRPELCPVHVLGAWVSQQPGRSKPFMHIASGSARQDLKRRLFRLGIDCANSYWLHDLRRGHAQDMVDEGGRLCEILQAGQWKSPAFTKYLDLEAVEMQAVVEAHMAESEDEDEAALLGNVLGPAA